MLQEAMPEILAFEIDRHLSRWRYRLASEEKLGSECQYFRHVHFEHTHLSQAVRKSQRARVESCAEDHDLFEPGPCLLDKHVIEVLRASVEVAERTREAFFQPCSRNSVAWDMSRDRIFWLSDIPEKDDPPTMKT